MPFKKDLLFKFNDNAPFDSLGFVFKFFEESRFASLYSCLFPFLECDGHILARHRVYDLKIVLLVGIPNHNLFGFAFNHEDSLNGLMVEGSPGLGIFELLIGMAL